MSSVVLRNHPDIPIELKPNARARRITLRRSTRDGGFTVSYPKKLPHTEVQSFIDAHEGWILKHYQPSVSINIGSVLPFRGQELPIFEGAKRGAHLTPDGIAVRSANPGRAIVAMLKTQAHIYALPRVDDYARRVGSHANELRWRDPKSRWGSCDSDGNIMLSWRLIMLPDTIFDYVIAHECAHLVHMDHSHRFWNLVGDIYPSFETERSALRREGAYIQRISFG